MFFDWQAFLDNNGIEYTDKGRNVSKGNLALHCPFCGTDDEGMHMNVSLRGRGWACWRSVDHRGANPARLVQALLKCSWTEAVALTGIKAKFVPQQVGLAEAVGKMLWREDATTAERWLRMPKELKPLGEGGVISRQIITEYLMSRGYSNVDVTQLAHRFEIHHAVSGEWARRVVWPLRNEYGTLINLTGRAVGHSNLRYKTSRGEEGAARISQCLLDTARLFRTDGNVLVVCEGPMDAMRMSWLGETFGLYATCAFTANVSDDQADLLFRLESRFENRYVLFDNGARLQAMRAKQQLGSGWQRAELPAGVKDPGELSPAQLLTLCRQLCVVS